MSGQTSVPSPTFGPQGFILPTETLILDGILADLNAAFGAGFNPALETPQGQIASTFTAIVADQNDQYLLVTQNVDPAFSSGRMQDAIGRIYFLERFPARPTVVSATCRGLQRVTIPFGALARADDGNFYTATAAGTIDATGTVTLPFACMVDGPIACPAGSLNQVRQVIPGWDSITNNQDGEIGVAVEGRAAFEQRRFDSVAGNSAGMLASVQSAVLKVSDVLDAYTTENVTSAPVVLDGVTLPAHSLYVCTSGGSPPDIANAIFTRKAPGCNMAGNTTVTVQDTNGGYAPPAPSYSITFQTAIPQTFVMTVTIYNSPTVPADAVSQIQTAVMRAWAGQDGGPRARIGSVVFASRFYAPIAALGSWAQIVSIKLGSDQASAASFIGSITNNILTVSSLASGAVAVSQTLDAAGIPDGVHIISGSGSSWTLDYMQPPTVPYPPGPMLTILAGLDDVKAGIAHAPVLSAANITVVLQ